MDVNPYLYGDPADPALLACRGCGVRHKHRTTLEHLCPCCMHPHDSHEATQRRTGCSKRHCPCKWPNAAPIVRMAAVRIHFPAIGGEL